MNLRTLVFSVCVVSLGARASGSSDNKGEGFFAPFARELGLATDPSAPKPCTLAALRANPESYKGIRVSLVLQVNERTQFWNPFFTRFTPDNYVNVSVWGEEQRLWVQSEYQDDYPLVFADRRSEVARSLLAAETYDRMQVTAVVRDTFRGSPWIELLQVTPQAERMTTGTLVHAARGRKWMETGKWTLAANEYERAMTAGLPRGARVALLKDLGACHYARGDRESTRTALLAAARLDPKDSEVSAALESLLEEGAPSATMANASETAVAPQPAETAEPPSAETTPPANESKPPASQEGVNEDPVPPPAPQPVPQPDDETGDGPGA